MRGHFSPEALKYRICRHFITRGLRTRATQKKFFLWVKCVIILPDHGREFNPMRQENGRQLQWLT